jgi:hypothetical protein
VSTSSSLTSKQQQMDGDAIESCWLKHVMSLDVRAKHSEIGERHFLSRLDFTSLPALICLVISFVVFGISIGFSTTLLRRS